MTERLKHNIKNIYKEFSKYKATDMTGSSLYEDLPKWNLEILSKSLHELDENDLSRFTGKAMTTWGNANDYKHFLPRIFELTAVLNTPYEIWIVFDKLILAEWESWAKLEQNLVLEFMIALWESIVNDNSEKAEWEFQDYFTAIAHFYPNFNDLLNIWTESESKAGIKHLTNYIVDESYYLFNKGRLFEFGETINSTSKLNEFKSWLLSDKILNKIQQKYFEFEAESFAEKISWAEQILTNEKKNTAHNNGYK